MQTAAKEDPITMHGVEVRAILEGRMSQCRRVMKPQPDGLGFWGYDHDDNDDTPYACFGSDIRGMVERIRCPYGPIGTRLWVRETWDDWGTVEPCIIYRADCLDEDERPSNPRWRPSVHLPRWASRLTLEVVTVRVGLLQSITEEDIKAGGVEGLLLRTRPDGHFEHVPLTFQHVWDELNPKHPWVTDPWVWRVAFRRV